jgi:PAS domain S-box-containing protein
MDAKSGNFSQPLLGDRGVSEPAACPVRPESETLGVPNAIADRWSLLTFRVGVLAVVFLQVLYLVRAMKIVDEAPLALDLHVLITSLPILVFLSTWFSWFRRYWRQLVMVMSVAVIWGTTVLSFLTGGTLPVFIILVLTLAVAAPLPWNQHRQGLLSAFALTAFAIIETLEPSHDRYEFLAWFGVLTTIGIAQIAMHLRAAQQRLAAQLEELKEAQARASHSEATLRRMLDAIPGLVVFIRFSDGRLIEVNHEFLRRTGLSREEALSASTGDLDLYARQEDRTAAIRKLKTEGEFRQCEIELKLQGVVVPHVISAAIIDFQGEACAVTIGQDITSIKDSERVLRETQNRLSIRVGELTAVQERLRAEIAERKAAERLALERETTLRKIFQASPDHIAIRRLSDNRYIDINKEMLLTGYSREEAMGKRPEDLNIFANPAQSAEADEKLLREGRLLNLEVELRHKDGRILDGLMSATVAELDGELCAISISRDISQIKQTERALQAAQQRLNNRLHQLTNVHARLRIEVAERETAERNARDRAETLRKLFEANLDSIIVRRLRDSRILEVNKEFTAVTGYTREEAIGKPYEELCLWVDPAQFKAFAEQLKTTGRVRNQEADIRCKNGQIVNGLTSCAIVEIDGEPCSVSVIRDITARKHIENELIATREAALSASRAKSEFLSSMSHEIRTPMNAILGMADILCETDLDADQRRYLETMQFNGGALLEIIDDILDLAKVESGRLQLETIDFDLAELVDKVTETLAARAHGKGLELVARVAPDTPLQVVGDPLRLRQVLMNLLGNAIKFTELGEVALTVLPGEGAEDGLLHFSVADTGIGIDREKIGTIFSDFTQADSSTTRRYGGSGLGLAIVTRLVEVMGGRIWVESELGKGSTFHFTARLQPSCHAGDSRPIRPNLEGVRALVADSSSNNRLIFAETLGPCGAAVVEAATAQELTQALDEAAVAGRPFDLVFTDYQMRGAERLVGLATAAGGAKILVPMITTDDMRTKIEELNRFGIQTYLRKPLNRMELLDIASRVAVTPAAGNDRGSAKVRAIAPRRTASLPSPDPARTAAAPTFRLLLADDSPDNRLVIGAYLKRLPYMIEVAENGSVAVDKFVTGHYDLVLMDIQMPVLDGYAAVRMMRNFESEHHLPATPILALTASTLEDDVRRVLAAGCQAHVAKPVRKDKLLAAIAAALENTTPRSRDSDIQPHYSRAGGLG